MPRRPPLFSDKSPVGISATLELTSTSPLISDTGQTRFQMQGLYSLKTDQGVIEVVLTNTITLARSAAYPSPDTVYIILPQGEYSFQYRVITSIGKPPILNISPLPIWERLRLYLLKVMSLGFYPKRWVSAIRSRMSSRHRMVELKKNFPRPVYNPLPIKVDRILEKPTALMYDTAVSIIIPTKTRYDLLRPCLESLERVQGVSTEVIVVDNGATDPHMLALLAEIAKKPNIQVLRHDFPFNFSRLCNLGAAEARYPLLLFLNDDVEALDNGWLAAMCGFALREDVGVVGARLLYPSGDLQHGGIAVNLLPGPGHPWRNAPQSVWATHPLLATAGEVDAVTGACLMMRRDIFNQLNGFDEVHFPVTMNDVDICLKVRRSGLKVIYTPEATLLHKESQSRFSDEAPSEIARRTAELKTFVTLYSDMIHCSVFYPATLRRNTQTALPIL